MNRNELIKVICILKNYRNEKATWKIAAVSVFKKSRVHWIGSVLESFSPVHAKTMTKNLLVERLRKPPFSVLKNAV